MFAYISQDVWSSRDQKACDIYVITLSCHEINPLIKFGDENVSFTYDKTFGLLEIKNLVIYNYVIKLSCHEINPLIKFGDENVAFTY